LCGSGLGQTLGGCSGFAACYRWKPVVSADLRVRIIGGAVLSIPAFPQLLQSGFSLFEFCNHFVAINVISPSFFVHLIKLPR